MVSTEAHVWYVFDQIVLIVVSPPLDRKWCFKGIARHHDQIGLSQRVTLCVTKGCVEHVLQRKGRFAFCFDVHQFVFRKAAVCGSTVLDLVVVE